jgi:hypothetical protein
LEARYGCNNSPEYVVDLEVLSYKYMREGSKGNESFVIEVVILEGRTVSLRRYYKQRRRLKWQL